MRTIKLVRDKIPEILMRQGKKFRIIGYLKGPELVNALIGKLYEEVREFEKSRNIEELADILEVVDGLASALGSNLQEVLELKKRKQEERGGFYRGIVIELED